MNLYLFSSHNSFFSSCSLESVLFGCEMIFFHWVQRFIFFFLSLLHDYIMGELGFKCMFSVSRSLFSIAYSCKYTSCNLIIRVQYLWRDTLKYIGSGESSSRTGSFETDGTKQLCIEQLPFLRNYIVGTLHIWCNFSITMHFCRYRNDAMMKLRLRCLRKFTKISEQLSHKIMV